MKETICPNYGFYVRFIAHKEDGDQDITARLGCGSWCCPVCGPKNAAILKATIKRAVRGYHEELETDGFRPEYLYKFLTLTVPGYPYRTTHTPDEAEKEMKAAFNKLRTALKKRLGDFEYIWVYEKQRDGFPHMHVLLIGKAIADKSLLGIITNLWCNRYQMGFVRLNTVKGGINSIVHYLAKYATKGLETGLKGNRVYSMSRKISKHRKKKKANITIIEIGRIVPGDDGKEQFLPIWIKGQDPPDEGDLANLPFNSIEVANWLGEWFENQAKMESQLKQVEFEF